MINRKSVAVLVLLLAASTATASASTRWLHLRISDQQKSEKVSINLPVSLIEAIAAIVPSHRGNHVHMKVDGCDISSAEMRDAWLSVRTGAEGRAVDIRRKGHVVSISRSRGQMVVNIVEGRNGPTFVRMPAAVADALFAGREGEPTLAQVMQALAASSGGELTLVSDDGDSIRMWVDQSSESR